MCVKTLEHMRAGGVYDQVGYGFHRYSTDAAWKVPHFEKMLYDQALLLRAYTEAFQATGRDLFRRTACEILEFLRREMRSPEGGFYSAVDADSEGEEGRYYLWDYDDFIETIESVDGVETPGRWAHVFHVKENGNWTDSVSGGKQDTNILHCDTDELGSLDDNEWNACRAALLERRSGRSAPSMDDKILAGWNGLVISAMARTAWAIDDQELLEEAREAARFIRQSMRNADGGLLHSYREGRAGIRGNLEDYAFLIDGLLSLYQADFEPAHIEAAAELADYIMDHFHDRESGGFFLTDNQVNDVPGRSRSVYDSAMPSGISVLLHSMDLLFRITADTKYRTAADGLKDFIMSFALRNPSACTMSLSLPEWIGVNQTEIVITGDGAEADGMIEVLRRRFMPGTVILRKNELSAESIGRIAPYTRAMGPRTAAYVCTDFQCKAPIHTASELEDLLIKLDKNTRNK
ncbi:MAG: thioredoxin domain-containing protein [Sediminispirochaetaceae bacterium]